MCNIASRFSHITNRLHQPPTAPQSQQTGTKKPLEIKQFTILFVVWMLFVIVLPYAVLVLRMKASSQQTLRLHMGATSSATKAIAKIWQQNQALQSKPCQNKKQTMYFKDMFLFFCLTLPVANGTDPPKKNCGTNSN